ncbi:MAG: family 1 glycosylhydrolase [Armatimonadetes bacterium]|nr:family 1 glycosylhydrolase [Candidatus Hippobium faecium]
MKIEFPEDFKWGAATSACQIEGSENTDGKVDSVWDVYAEAGRCLNGDTPRVACDHYHKYKEDVALLKKLGVKVYRFSVCWPRVISDINGTVNEKGLQFYSDLVDELIAAGIEPWPTLFHWDHPQFIEEAFEGFTSREIVPHFKHYCEVVVKKLGDRVKNWMTINEPCNSTIQAYGTGACAPGKKLENKKIANSIHNILMCHGTAVKVIKETVKDAKVGIVFNPVVLIPAFEDEGNKAMVDTIWSMDNGYFLDPIYKGTYPERTYRGLPDCRPDVMEGDMELISQPCDFLGMNAYYAYSCRPDGYGFENCVFYVKDADWINNACMPMSDDTFYYGVKYLYDHYDIKNLYVTENGNAWITDTKEEQLDDDYRIDYIQRHLKSIRRVMDEGYKVSGYFYWSLMDNFEWGSGYKWKFGLLHIDENLNRVPKKSYYWFKECIENNGFEAELSETKKNEGDSRHYWAN